MQAPLTTKMPKRLTAIADATSKLALAIIVAGLALMIVNPAGIGLPLMFAGLVAYLILANRRPSRPSEAGDE